MLSPFYFFPDASLDGLDQAVKNTITQAYAEGTWAARRSQTRRYLEFCVKYQLWPLPVSTQDLCRYAVYLGGSLQYTSLISYMDGVQFLHTIMDYPAAPISHPKVKLVLRGLKRKLSQQTHQKLPLTPAMLLNVRRVLDLSLPTDQALWAALLCGWFAFFRRSNLVPPSAAKFDPTKHLTRGDFTFTSWGLIIAIRWSKTIQFRQRTLLIPMLRIPGHPLCPWVALKTYFNTIPTHDASPAFMTPDARGNLKTLTHSTLGSQLHRVLTLAGYQSSLYATHSLRRGGATFASGLQNVSSAQIQLQGDWQTAASMSRYTSSSLSQRMELARTMATAIATHH